MAKASPSVTPTTSVFSWQNREDNRRTTVILALISVYIIWGSTYLAIRIGLEMFPPVTLNALRFGLSSVLVMGYLLWKRQAMPPLKQILNAMFVGVMTLGIGTTSVSFAEQWVSSGIAALSVASVPLWVAIFSALVWRSSSRREWFGLFIGFLGILLLNSGGDLRANPQGALALLLGPLGWSLGSIISRKIELPKGMMAIGWELVGAFLVLGVLALLIGEPIREFSFNATLAMLYLATFGSLIGFTSYMYLLDNVRPALATSYAYVNPIVAVLLGVIFVGETITLLGVVAMVIILGGVVIVVTNKTP